MKKYLFLSLLMFAYSAHAQLWVEDFSGEANGATSGIAAGTLGGTWSVTTTPSSGTFSKQTFFGAGGFHINNTTNEGVWATNTIDITSVGYAIISAGVAVGGFGFSASDYLRFYYILDGGPETLFADISGSLLSVTTEASAIVAGSSLQIIARAVDNSIFGLIIFDDVTITAAPVIYSRKSGTWTDVTGGPGGTGTWSLTGHTGSACGCYPLNTQVAVIGDNDIVTLPVSQTTVGIPPTLDLAPGAVDVVNTGTLQFNVNGVTLGIQQGLLRVRSGGTINSSSGAVTGERITFQANVGGARLQVDAGGSAAFEDLELAAGATSTHFLEGGGSLTITDDIIISADDATLTNNMTTTVAVGDQIQFSNLVNDSEFVNNGVVTATTVFFNNDNDGVTNNGTLTLAGDLFVNNAGDDGNSFTNSVGSTLNLAGIDLNDGNFTINNSGTINQTGDFIDIDVGSNGNFNNLATGVWNWSLTPNTTYDTDMATVLDCAAVGNTFNYNGPGDQQIIPVQYGNLTLSNSGAKDANDASISLNGNWLVSGTATFTEGTTSTVTFNGTSGMQTLTSTGTETFRNLTFNNTFGTSPQITLNNDVTVALTLTMTDGNINLNNNTFTIGTGTTGATRGTLIHAGSSANGWMYRGSLNRFFITTAITIGDVDQNEGFYPLGSSSDFRPFFIGKSNTGSSAGSILVTHNNLTTTSIVSFPEGIVRRHDASWAVSTSGISAGTWALRAGGTNFGTIQETADLRMSTSTGVVGTHAAAIGGPTDWRVNRTGLLFGELTNSFHLASTDAINSPLPVTLLFLKAEPLNDDVQVNWATSKEEVFSHFVLEHSVDGFSFSALEEIPGAGYNTDSRSDYSYTHTLPIIGNNYYRLKAVDLDGSYEYFGPIGVRFNGDEELWIYPNPSSNSQVKFNSNFLPGEGDRVLVYNNLGSILADVPVNDHTNVVYFDEPLKAGAYILKYVSQSNTYFARFIVVE